jgi:probable F420-dependent oxidoreductase
MMRPFRFTAQVPDLAAPSKEWRDAVARIGELGFDTLALADHFTGGYQVEPFVALAAAASATELRLQTAVLGVDYRHPVLVHRMAATLDVISDGRVELGLGAGWMRSDYDAAGIAYDAPGTRIERLAEHVAVLKGLFVGEPFTYAGEHYVVNDLVGVPTSVQRPHPPLLIGGGGPRMLRLAAREADIVGINANLSAGSVGGDAAVLDVGWESMAEKVGWVRDAAAAHGRDPASIELSMAQWLLHVSASTEANDAVLHKVAARVGVAPEWIEAAPGVLVGSVARCVEKLLELRERLGISYVQVHAGPRGVPLEAFAPVIASLTDR